jgi:CO/xanthine dehydrogenase Mo-binding subunit
LVTRIEQRETARLSAPTVTSKVAGTAMYAADLVSPNAAVITLVRSPFPHARITNVEIDEALRQDGVLDVLTGPDFGDFRLGSVIEDQLVLADQKVRYLGEPVVAIAATTAELGRRASAFVRIDYERLPHCVGTDPEARSLAPVHDECPDNVAKRLVIERGDLASALARVDEFAEGTFEIAAAHHCYMEPYAVYATFEPVERIVRIHTPTHAPGAIIAEYRAWFDRWHVAVELKTPTIGGAFGAKYEHPLHLICGEFARRLGRDVAIVLSRKDDFISGNPRPGIRLWVRIGATSAGRLVTKEARVVADNGAYSLHAPSVLLAAMMRMDNLYTFEAVREEGELVYTNKPPSQCQRGFGDPEGAFAQEQLVDDLARRLAMSPFEIRALNATEPDTTTIHGWDVTSCALKDCLAQTESMVIRDRAAAERAPDRSRDVAGPAADGAGVELGGVPESDRFVVGWGVAAGMHTVGNRLSAAPDSASVVIRLTPDGIEVDAGEVDVGQGTREMLSRIVSSALGVDPAAVRVVLGDTEKLPLGAGSYSSRTTFFTGNAALDAAARIRVACGELEAELATGPLDPLELAAEVWRLGIDPSRLEVVGEYVSERSTISQLTGDGNRSPAYSFAVHGCRARVDRWTGAVTIENYWASHDAGAIIWPQGATGQVIGGVLQAVGQAISEHVKTDSTGLMLNAGFLDYRIPTARDAVPTTVVFTEPPDPEGPLGAKGVAEIPLIPVAACIANAIHDATGVRMHNAPMEPEVVLAALQRAGTLG